ncbi:hypothetical protein TIFTF001_019915 [Ficus carica]|uniref:Uncharacterized protein n=1 Tax=Ficus carica TaxID=3494 RepID=A0AA88ATG0_FICCA|nr:hypothetical protein TIFTF001_019915 [Ficus carica]
MCLTSRLPVAGCRLPVAGCRFVLSSPFVASYSKISLLTPRRLTAFYPKSATDTSDDGGYRSRL